MELKKLHNLAISDSGFIFDPTSGHSYTANETALFVISKLKNGANNEEIITAFTEEYEVERNIAEQDTVGVVEQLTANYLI